MLLGWLSPYRTADTGVTTGATGADVAASSAGTQNTGADTQAEHMIPKSRFDEVNSELQKLRAERQKQEQTARAEADKQAAAKGEFEKLANERGQRVTQLEAEHATATEQLAAYREAMEKQIKARLKELPEEIQALDPGGDVLVRYEWLSKAAAAAQKLAATRSPGTPPGPRGSGAQSVPATGDAEKLIAEKRARVGGL